MSRLVFGAFLLVWMLSISAIGLMALMYAPHSPNPDYATDVSILLAINVICVLIFVYTAIQLYFKKDC